MAIHSSIYEPPSTIQFIAFTVTKTLADFARYSNLDVAAVHQALPPCGTTAPSHDSTLGVTSHLAAAVAGRGLAYITAFE